MDINNVRPLMDRYWHYLTVGNSENSTHTDDDMNSKKKWPNYLTYVALAYEECPSTHRPHLQFYVEFSKPVYGTHLATIFSCEQRPHSEQVKNATRAYNYCTGNGKHKKKPFIERYEFGETKVAGDALDSRLKIIVDWIVDGMNPAEIASADPYGYAVHCRRIWDLYKILNPVGMSKPE